jgi:predicted phage-related endonuclease
MGDGFTADEVPDDYYCQVQHYMAVTGLRWFILSVYEIMSDEVRHYYIPRNVEFIDRLIAAEGDFWENFVLKNVTPAPIGIENEEDLITGMYSPSDGVIVLTEAEIELCRIRTDASAREKSAKEEKEKADCALKLAITNRMQGSPAGTGKLSAVAGSFSISWSRFPQRRVDSDLLKKDGLYDKYSKEGESRRFVVNPPKVAV